MSEQEIREGMLLAVWDEPPLDFDPDKLIRRVEQKKSRRRALVGVGVATAMIVVTSLTLPGLLPRDGDAQLGATGQSTTPSSTRTLSPYEREQRIGDGLTSKLLKLRPEMKDVYASFNWKGTGFKPEAPLQQIRQSVDSTDLYGFVYFQDSIGPTALLVTTGSAVSQSQLCSSGAIFCRDVPQRDGTVVTEAEFQEGPDIVKAVSMRRLADSSRAVVISSYAHNPMSGTGFRKTIPVGVDVLTALVADPAITWE
ncbi:hypothetical protein ACWEIJ_07870 [Lentzea sp. NPDC004789]